VLVHSSQSEPAHADYSLALHDALPIWQEEVRQARERREQVAAAVADAKAAPSHAAAIAALERAQAVEPGNKDVEQLLRTRREALAREEEETQRARERAAAIAAALTKARETPAHETAIQILERALALDASHSEVRRELGG